MSALLSDLRFAFRTFLRSPGFTLVIMATLALGIGANTAVFSVINTVLLRPLPYPEPDRLTLVWTNFGPDLPQNWVSGPEFMEMREFQTLFEDIGVIVPFTAAVTGAEEPEQVSAAGVSGNFFELVQTEAVRGRLFRAQDDQPGADRLVVLNDGFWRRRLGGDKRVLGQTIRVDGLLFTVVGILAPDFAILHPDAQFPKQIDLWLPMTVALKTVFGTDRYEKLPRGDHFLRAFGKMKPGVTLAQARADMNAVAARIQEKSPNYYDFEGWGITVLSLSDDLVAEVRPALLILLGAVGFVLLIACVNVANLLLARGAGREREMAVRSALGAGRARLLRQLVTESLSLALIGGLLGMMLALILVRVVVLLGPDRLPRGDAISIDGGVLLFTFLLSLLTGLLFGLAPVWHCYREDLVESLKEGGRGATTGIRGTQVRKFLVIAEVALALVLLVGAGLMLRSFARLLDSSPGYRSDHLLTLAISLPQTRYRSSEQVSGFYDRLLERVGALPGVVSAGAISQLPLSGSYSSGTTRIKESETVPADRRALEADRRRISPDYFQTMGARILRGRAFTAQDHATAPLVAIVDERFVQRFWPNEDPIGKHVSIRSNEEGRVWDQVVGVVEHQKHYNLNRVGREQVYFPYKQAPANTMYLAIRTAVAPSSLASSVRTQVWAIDGDQPVDDVQTMTARVDSVLSQPRFNLMLLSGFALVALILAAVGIYGVMSYSVSQRHHEIGVRMALGADADRVRSLVLRQGLTLVLLALAAGLTGAFLLTRLMTNLLFDVHPADPLTYGLVAALLLLVAAVACYLPALRATRVDPVRVLHSE
ncbi:MAG: ABC transporter permease [Acidobacteriota bacterium]